ncbi:MAG: excisionase [Candidatus Faecousia sp.]|nr:excisionase [Candidatus Faecousia sp.]
MKSIDQISSPIGYGAFSIHEAAKYSSIGITQMDELLKQPNRSFVLYVGTKKRVTRKAFEE